MKISFPPEFSQKFKNISGNKTAVFFSISAAILILSILYISTRYYEDRIFPNSTIDSIDVSGLSALEAKNKLENNPGLVEAHTLSILVDDIEVASSSSELGAFRNYEEAAKISFENTRSQKKSQFFINLLKSFIVKNKVSSDIWYQDEELYQLTSLLNEKVLIEGRDPNVLLGVSGKDDSIVVFKGSPGRTLDVAGTLENIKLEIKNNHEEIPNNNLLVEAKVASTSAVLNQDQIEFEIERAKKFVGKKIELRAENKVFELNDKDLISLIKPLEKYDEGKIAELIIEWSDEINRGAQDAEFEYDEKTLEVKVFKPHKDGLEVDKIATQKLIIELMEKIESGEDMGAGNGDENGVKIESSIENESKVVFTTEIPLNRTSPKTTLESTNNLGIKESIGFGESYYHHSIPNRVHNVGITAERISLTIVPPGEEFSFNRTLGDVSAATGFRSAYVISGGKTVLGDGGGVCQVSSTLFRAILDAGLEVTKRLQHSYRVSYYELNSDPGFDATVYSGDVDFRFINDANNHILVYSYVEPENRYMNIEIYGTDDGRTTEISNYKKWDFRGAPPAEYYPSTEIPAGTLKQIDWSVSGIKTEFTHTIKDEDGNVTSEETYYSNYRPWSAKYLQGV